LDEPSWQSYRVDVAAMAARNINRFVRDLTRGKAIRPEVEVGISPFGIWRPRNPRQIRGLDASRRSTPTKTALQQGWVDYPRRSFRWPIEKREQSFPRSSTGGRARPTRPRHRRQIKHQPPATRVEIARARLARRASVGRLHPLQREDHHADADGIDDRAGARATR
jgi:uncharacterized lipoprotein YddW (UPF0748 family)